VFSVSWVLALGTGYLLVSIPGNLSRDNDLILAGATLLGGWCSICATSLACVLAEPIWKSSQRGRARPRNWLSQLPMATLLSLAVLLLLQTPLPLWAPTVTIARGGAHDPGVDASYPLPGNWTGGRWIRISNPLDDPLIVSISPTGNGIQGLFLVGPDNHAQWFPHDVDRLYPIRKVDFALEAPSPCTYAVVLLAGNGLSLTEPVRESILDSSLAVWRVGCRAILSNGDTVYNDGLGSISSGGIDALTGVQLLTTTLDCKLGYPPEQITRMEMIVLFESPGERCSW
jgi:hypothetical protein